MNAEKNVYCWLGGYMEKPEYSWVYMGSATGNTPQEVCDNLAKADPKFAHNYDFKSMTWYACRLKVGQLDVSW